jgi:hypothetical protein
MSDAPVEALSGSSALGNSVRQRGVLAAGIVSGLLGGAVTAIFLVVAASAAGMPALYPLKVIGATFVGPEALGGGSGPVLYGAALHALTSIALGLVFASLVPRELPPLCGVVVGMGYALFVAGIMTSLVVPAVNPAFRGEMQPIGGSWVIAHALFGLALGLSHALSGRAPRGGAAGP